VFEGARLRLHHNLRNWFSPRIVKRRNRAERRVLLHLEELESRALLSATSAAVVPSTDAASSSSNSVVQPLLTVVPEKAPSRASSTPAISGFTPQQIQQAYGVPSSINGQLLGKGETIAIVDAYNDPSILSDANKFSSQFSLPTFNSGGPTLTVESSTGVPVSNLQTNSGWAGEISLDVEWAHAIAPDANIILVEAPTQNLTGSNGLLAAVSYAANQPNVSVVSMSWGQSEFSNESNYDSTFTHPGITYVAASGDNSAYYGPIYPATSPYVLAVGGTSLTTSPTGVYQSESAWFGSGGGYSSYEGQPSYQYNQPSIGLTNSRLTPDVAYNANPNTGFAIYDSTPFGGQQGWIEVGGTSAGAPQWSAIVALADQQRGSSLDTNQVQTTLYNTLGTSTYSKVFHDITTGSNGYAATPGYDLATGLGTPIVNQIVPLLAKTQVAAGLPKVQGAGTAAGFSSSSFFGFFARSAPGGGLYTSTGSVTLPANSSPANGEGIPTPPSALTSPLNAPLSASTPTTANNNLFGAFNTASQGSEAATPVNIALANSSNASLGQSNLVFGASGVNGAPDSWRLSSLGMNSSQIDQLAGDLAGFLSEDANDSSDDNDTSPPADDSGGDLSALDATTPVLLESDAGSGGDE
jgi:subtilase family serine protease